MAALRVVFLGSERSFPILREAAEAAGVGLDRVFTPGALEDALHTKGYAVAVVEDGVSDAGFDELMRSVRGVTVPVMPVLIVSDEAGLPAACALVRAGAYRCADSRTGVAGWTEILESALEEVRSRLIAGQSNGNWRDTIVGASPRMQDMARIIALVAPRRCTVLITGETGTGKEVAARAIHMASDRAAQRMVALNCSAIPEHLLEAELFGHTRGAFTGAANLRIGRFEEANNSTLFLDEIGDMPLDLQAKLLRVLQEREVQRLGSSDTLKVNVRVIAASNLDLLERVKQNKFREDLFYRLNVVPIQMPPLRARPTDISLLARHFVAKICRLEGIPAKELYNDTLQHLASYHWPGNVRQLENMVEKAIVMSGDRQVLRPSDFVLPLEPARVWSAEPVAPVLPDDGVDFSEMVMAFEKNILDQALQKARGNKTMAANLLRLKRTTLVSKLQVYGVQ